MRDTPWDPMHTDPHTYLRCLTTPFISNVYLSQRGLWRGVGWRIECVGVAPYRPSSSGGSAGMIYPDSSKGVIAKE